MYVNDVASSPVAAPEQEDAIEASSTHSIKRSRSRSPWYKVISIWTIPILLGDLFFLTIYVILLLPGFLPMAWFYFTTHDRISVRYKSDSCRNTLDVYGSSLSRHRSVDAVGTVQHTTKQQPQQQHKKSLLKPVILFLPGGAFTIGYKLWAALLAQALVPAGLLIVVADYRNYPWGDIPAMLDDADDALRWTTRHCQHFGGNPQQIILVGQSAGAHLGLMTVLRHAHAAATAVTTTAGTATTLHNEPLTQQLPKIKGFIGLSGVYDMQELVTLCANHAIPPTFVSERLLGNCSHNCDPTQWLLQQERLQSAARLSFPPIELWHGTVDRTVRDQQAPVLRLFQKYTHTGTGRLAMLQVVCLEIETVCVPQKLE